MSLTPKQIDEATVFHYNNLTIEMVEKALAEVLDSNKNKKFLVYAYCKTTNSARTIFEEPCNEPTCKNCQNVRNLEKSEIKKIKKLVI